MLPVPRNEKEIQNKNKEVEKKNTSETSKTEGSLNVTVERGGLSKDGRRNILTTNTTFVSNSKRAEPQRYYCHICVCSDKSVFISFDDIDKFQEHILSSHHKMVGQRNNKLFCCSIYKRMFGHDVNNWVQQLTNSRAHKNKLNSAGDRNK